MHTQRDHRQPRRWRRARPLLGLGTLLSLLVVVSSLANLGAGQTLASSHREAPLISADPQADNTDTYAFVSPDRPDTVTLIASFYPFQNPAGGPNFYRFGDDVAYDLKIDNTGDAVPDIVYRFNFSTSIRNPNIFLYNTGPIDSLDSQNWNIRQFYGVTEFRNQTSRQLSEGLIVPPANVGQKSTPDYAKLQKAAIYSIPTSHGEIKVFAGPSDDPFWVDLGLFDLLSIRKLPGNHGGGVDSRAGYNVMTIAMQIPIAELTADGSVPKQANDPHAVIGYWSTASRFTTTVIGADGTRKGSGDLVQVSRLGMPLVNEVVVPVGAKDLFNASDPVNDAQFVDGVVHPALPGLLHSIYGITVPSGDRNDLVSVFLTGVSGLNQPPNVKPAEMVRLNMAIPPAKAPNRLGVLGGDTAGFPNGRRLEDDVVDIELRVVAGVLVGKQFDVAPNNQLGDGVDYNDVPYQASFPYVALPHGGTEAVGLGGQERTATSNPGAGGAAAGPTAGGGATPAASPAAVQTLHLTMNELNGSGVSGTADLSTDGNGDTTVVLKPQGATGGHPAHIHKGTCNNLDPNPLYPLTDVDANGSSTTAIKGVTIADLTSQPFAINVHKSRQQFGVYVACTNITS